MGEILKKLMSDPSFDHEEVNDWLETLADIKARYGAERAAEILTLLQETEAFLREHLPTATH